MTDIEAVKADWLAGVPFKVIIRQHPISLSKLRRLSAKWMAAGLRHPRVDRKRLAAIKADYLAGILRRDIARKYGIDTETVSKYAAKYWRNERRPTSRLKYWLPEHDAEAARLFHDGMFVREIARRMGWDETTIGDKLAALGLRRTGAEVRQIKAFRRRMMLEAARAALQEGA